MAWSGEGTGDADGVFLRRLGSAPTTSGIANVSVYENSSPTTVGLWPSFDDAENSDAQLTYTVTADTNPTLFSGLSVNAATGELSIGYAQGQFGTANLTVRATDPGGLWVETSFSVTVSLKPGLVDRSYTGEYTTVPNFNTLQPNSAGIVNTPSDPVTPANPDSRRAVFRQARRAGVGDVQLPGRGGRRQDHKAGVPGWDVTSYKWLDSNTTYSVASAESAISSGNNQLWQAHEIAPYVNYENTMASQSGLFYANAASPYNVAMRPVPG